MSDIQEDVLRTQLRAVLEQMAKLPRHPRGFQGPVVPEDIVILGVFRDPNTGALYTADPAEQAPGEGETPESDLFLRDYVQVGKRRGTSLIDVLLRLAPVIQPGVGGPGGIFDVITNLFGKKRR